MAKTLTPLALKNLRPRGQVYEVADRGCRGLRVLVQTSGHRSWAVRYRYAGRTRKLTLGPVLIEDRAGEVHSDSGAPPAIGTPLTLTDARWLCAQALRTLKSGSDPATLKPQDRAQADDSVRAIAAEYLKRQSDLRSIAHLRRYTGLITQSLGSRPIAAVKLSDIIHLLDKVEEANGPAAADRVNSTWRSLAAWYAGRSDDYRPPIIRGQKRNKSAARARILTDGEIRSVWAAAEAVSGPFGNFVKLLLLTAARRREVSGMRRSELVGAATWILPAARCKTKTDVLIPLSAAAQKIIGGMPLFGDGDLVFTNDGKVPLGGYAVPKQRLDAASNVRGWTLHDLRRTARSLMSRAGVDADVAERCLGHAIGGIRGVYDRYSFEQEKRRAFAALARQIELILHPPENKVVRLRGRR